MENTWSIDSIIDEKRLGTLPFYSLLFFFIFLGVGTLFFLFYPVDDRYSVLGRTYQKENNYYIECIFPLSKIRYLEKSFIYVKGKRYTYKIIEMEVISEKEGRLILLLKGKQKNPITRIEWRGENRTPYQRFIRSFRKE